MTPDSILSLLCKLNDTIDAQQKQIDTLMAQVRQLSPDAEEPFGDSTPQPRATDDER